VASVWYIGAADVRTIDSTEWTRISAPGATATWNKANGWSIDQVAFTSPQLAILNAMSEFVLTSSSGPRPGAVVVAEPNNEVTAETVAELIDSLTPVDLHPARIAPIQPLKQIISTFQSGHGWTATTAGGTTDLNDTTDVGLGAQSVKFVTNTANGSGTLDSPTLSPVDMVGKDIKLLVKVEGLANYADLRFYAGDTALSNAKNWNLGGIETAGSVVNYIKEGEWQWVTYMWDHGSNVGTPANVRNAITKFRLRAQAVNGQAMTVHLGAVAIVPQSTAFPRGVVSFTYDDGRNLGLPLARPKLDQYGYPATAFVIRNKIGTSGYVSLAQLKEAKDKSGWEIAAHADTSTTHDAGFDTLTASQVTAELVAQRRWMFTNGIGPSEGFAWPQGKSTAALEEAAAKVVAYGRNNSTVSRETFPPANPMRVRAFNVGPSTDLTSLQTLVDQTVASRGWLVLTFHDLVSSPVATTESSKTVHDGLVDYIAGLGVNAPAVVPMIDAMRTASGAPGPDIQVFPSSGTWVRPPNATRTEVICVGAGGSGGSGPRRASGTASAGGGGGAGGGISRFTFRTSDLSPTETVTIGAGSSGAASVTTDDTNGAAGTAGGSTTFGSRSRANGGAAGGAGGTSAASAAAGGAGTTAGTAGGTPAAGAVGGSAFTAASGAGGGAGGGISTTPAAFSGGAGGPGGVGVNGGGTAGTANNAGGAGAVSATGVAMTGGGGGGGGSSITGAGGAGGAAGAYGSGGGGGGASLNGSASGAGGASSGGICIVISD